MTIVLDGSAGITNDGGYTGDGVVFADTTPANTLVTTTGGNVGIGTSSPVKSLQVNGAIVARGGAPGTSNANNNGFAFSGNGGDLDSGLYSLADGMVNIFTNNSEVARFDSDRARFGPLAVNAPRLATVNVVSARSGSDWNNRQLLVEDTAGGAAEPAIGFHAPTNNSAAVFKMYGPSNNFECRNGPDTGFVAILASAFNVSSDYRIKTDVVEFGSVLSNVLALRPVNYEKDGVTGREYGLIAHEAAEHFPDLVQGEKDGMRSDGTMELQTVSYTGLTSVLVKAIQEQQAIITAQAAQIQQLREKVLEVEEGTSNMLVENTNNLYETITALTARVAALEGK